MRQRCKAQALISRYRARGVSGHAAKLAQGVVIGSIIVLLVWLMVG